MEKAYSHSILLQFLWFTSDISLLLCVCAQDRALPTMKWFKRLCRVSLETIKFQWESTLGHQNIFALAISWRLLADAWIWILSQVSSGRDTAQYNQQSASEVPVPLGKDHCVRVQSISRRTASAMPPSGPWLHWNVAMMDPRGLTEEKEQGPLPTGTHTSSVPKLRARGKQPSCLIPVRNHPSLLYGND